MGIEEVIAQENEQLKDKILFAHIDALEELVRAYHQYLLEIAPHSYQDGAKAEHLRAQWQALGMDKEDDRTSN